jgi:glutathione S-transferase
MSSKPRLYTFAISHFSEKIRWTLDHIGFPYEEVVWTPVLHIARALVKARRATTVPILEVDGEVIQDSTRILMWLEQHRAPFTLLPREDPERQAVLEIEQRFDQVGKHVIRYLYDRALQDSEGVLSMWTVAAGPVETAALTWGFPLVERTMRRRFRITENEVARSRGLIAESLAWLEARPKSPYLHGDRLTAADITTAALLAPLACPDEHPLYGQPRYREAVANSVEPFASSRALAWVRDLYRTHRRAARA